MGLWESFPAMRREEQMHRAHDDLDKITRFYMVGKERFLGLTLWVPSEERNPAKSWTVKTGCVRKKALSCIIGSLLTVIFIIRNFITTNFAITRNFFTCY